MNSPFFECWWLNFIHKYKSCETTTSVKSSVSPYELVQRPLNIIIFILPQISHTLHTPYYTIDILLFCPGITT